MSKLIVTIGIPGSGKSNWAKAQKGYVVVNQDDVRAQLGDVSDQSKNDQVYYLTRKRLRELLLSGQDVILDSTALGRGVLRNIRKLAAEVNCDLVYKIFECSPEVAKQRIRKDIQLHKNRSNVPDEVIDNLYERFCLIVDRIRREM